MQTNFEAQYPVKVIRGVRVRMRDGVELHAKITRPDAEGKFPAVMEYGPYRMQSGVPPQNYRDEIPILVPYLAERGYVVVQFEVRGTGSSSGYSETVYSEGERRDGHDMVEWIAAQEWCTGAVGMIGISHGAVVQWQVAVQQPPHLKTIIVRSANDDVYTEFSNPGGCIRPWMFEAYGPHMNASNFAPPNATVAGDKWAEIWRERLEKSVPWNLSHIRNTVDGPFWKSRSLSAGFERVKIPVFLIEGWADWYATAELRAFQKINVPKKVLIGPWGHYYPDAAFPGPRIDGRREYLKWFDYWLKGIDNGVMKEPPVTVFVRHWKEPALMYVEDCGQWRNESAWPPERAKQTTFYLGNAGRLGEELPRGEAADSYDYRASVGITTGRRAGLGSTTPWGLPLDQRTDEAYSLVYSGEPLAKAKEVMGEPEVILYVSSTAKVAYFHVKLCDVAPDGTSRLITDGGLLGTHRSSHTHPEAMEPGKIYELRFPLKHIAYRVDAGHRLRVSVASADFQNAWPTGERAKNSLYRGGAKSSRVVVPLVDAGSETLAGPEFRESVKPLPAESQVPTPVYTLHHDLVNDTVTCELAPPVAALLGERWDYRSRYTVSNRNPARAIIDATASYHVPHPTLDICVSTACLTTSDETSYTHISQVDITVNGKPYFQKSWTETVPRGYS